MEVLCTCALQAGAELSLLHSIMDCVTTDEAVTLLKQAGILREVMDILLAKIEFYMQKRVFDGIQIGAVIFSNMHGLLGMTKEAETLIDCIRNEITDSKEE